MALAGGRTRPLQHQLEYLLGCAPSALCCRARVESPPCRSSSSPLCRSATYLPGSDLRTIPVVDGLFSRGRCPRKTALGNVRRHAADPFHQSGFLRFRCADHDGRFDDWLPERSGPGAGSCDRSRPVRVSLLSAFPLGSRLTLRVPDASSGATTVGDDRTLDLPAGGFVALNAREDEGVAEVA